MVILILTAELPQPVFLVMPPPPLVVGCPLIVVINAISVLKTLPESSLVGLAAFEEIDALAVKVIFLPLSKIDVSDWIVEDALAFPQLAGSQLPHVLSIGEGHLGRILKCLEHGDELVLLCLQAVHDVIFASFIR